ncbi:hypothetical protein PFISCL1PPCAC_20187 [Pristionchus fissidentatus]|uniref:INTS8 TPR repeats domain-containing protein n=1 Tax=Pristionchus fissidentatus TaxID=1538716 RepID=A0AAV5WEJ7_9BILA|nr:hypothetical protein PFISCL1PPCAC_20187 [Pristionchus fissidentatus]
MDIDISSVHELWAAPKENWLDLFVNAAKLKKLLNEEKKSSAQRDEIRTLVLQFADQATQVEAETDTLIKKQFGADDITFHQRKSTCLWLCSLACMAAIDWNFETLLEKTEDVILINAIFDRIELWKEHLSSPSSISFSSFLISRWRLFVFARFRMPPPEAKPTVSNPCNQLDVVMQRFDHARMLIFKMREFVDSSHIILESILTEGKELRVPRPDCFIEPFVQEGGLSLSIGILGDNVLSREESLRPRLPSGEERDTVVIPAETVAQKIHFELASSSFCAIKLVKAVGSMKQLLKCLPSSSSSSHSLVRVDERKVNGMAAALRMPRPYEKAAPSTSREEVNGKITSSDPCPQRIAQRRYGVRRDRVAEEKARSLQSPISSTRLEPLSLCEDMWNGGGTVGWRAKVDGTTALKRKETVERLCLLSVPSASTVTLSPQRRSIVRGTTRFLAASLSNAQPDQIQSLVHCVHLPSPSVSLTSLHSNISVTPPPSAASIRAMAASDKPFWTLLTSFDAAELQAAFKLEGTAYTRPAMLRFPEVLADLLLNQRPVNELHALLLGKLQQLTEMGDIGRWQLCLDVFVPVLGLNTQTLVEMSIYEATRAQMHCLNRQLLTPHSDLKQSQVTLVQSVARKLVKISQVPPLVPPIVSFLLNLGEFSFVCKDLDPDAGTGNVLLNAGRILAAFGGLDISKPADAAGSKQVAETWHRIISPYFEAVASKRRHVGFTTMHLRETSRVRVDLMKLFESIKAIKLQSFLISYFANLYTQALAARGKAHLRIYAEHAELFAGKSLQLAHTDSVEEVLSLLLSSALALVPHSATFLRTKADFAYVRNQLSEAGVVYCELLVAVKSSLAMPFPPKNDVIDESVWNHLRICMRKNNHQTLAASVCQLFQTGRAKEFRKAAEAVQDRACLDASDDCFGLIYEVQLAEALTDAYRKRGQQHKLEAVLEVLAAPTMNANNGAEIVEREMRRKQKRLLSTLAALHFGIHF